MKVILEVPHPARAHMFRYLYLRLVSSGHEVIVLSKSKDGSEDLMRAFGVPFYTVGKNSPDFFAKLWGLLKETALTFHFARKFRPDVLVGGASPALALSSFLLRLPYVSVSDTEHARLTWLITKPFITRIITPKMFLHDYGEKHTRVNSFKELAYLALDRFKPNSDVLKKLDISDNERFVILRFISWGALHDYGQSGISECFKRTAVDRLSQHAKVFISAEGPLPKDLESYRLKTSPSEIHDVLFYSSLFFGESGTMATEAAVLGTPAIRVSSLAKLLGNSKELSETYRLLHFFEDFREALDLGEELLLDPNTTSEYQRRALKLQNEKIDLTDFLYTFITEKKYD